MAVDLVERLLEMVLVQVAGGDDLDIVQAEEARSCCRAPACPSRRRPSTMRPGGGGRAVPAQGAGRNDGGGGEGQTGGGKETAAADA